MASSSGNALRKIGGITVGLLLVLIVCDISWREGWIFANEKVASRGMKASRMFAVWPTFALSASPVSAPPFDPSNFVGHYSDPNHPNCKRLIQVAGYYIAAVSGTDGNPGCPEDGSGIVWALEGRIRDNAIVVDFSPKGGPSNLKGIYNTTEPVGIQWSDGNMWIKISDRLLERE